MIANKLSTALLAMTLTASVGTLFVVARARATSAQQSSELYTQRCAACHGPGGKGDGPVGNQLNPKPSDFAVSLKGKSDDWIARAIKGGGQAVGEAPVMPPFADLSDEQIKTLVDYIKLFGS